MLVTGRCLKGYRPMKIIIGVEVRRLDSQAAGSAEQQDPDSHAKGTIIEGVSPIEPGYTVRSF